MELFPDPVSRPATSEPLSDRKDAAKKKALPSWLRLFGRSLGGSLAADLAFTPVHVGFSFHTKFTFVNQYTTKGLELMQSHHPLTCIVRPRGCAVSVRVVMRPTSPFEGGCCMARLISRAPSLQIGLSMPTSVSRLAGEGGCCGEVPAAGGSSGRPLIIRGFLHIFRDSSRLLLRLTGRWGAWWSR